MLVTNLLLESVDYLHYRDDDDDDDGASGAMAALRGVGGSPQTQSYSYCYSTTAIKRFRSDT